MSSDNAIEDLEPSLVWEYFATLSSIPRCSKHEERIARYVCDVAIRLGLDFAQDAVGNVMVRKPAAVLRRGRGRARAAPCGTKGHDQGPRSCLVL